jgi:spore germination protein KC
MKHFKIIFVTISVLILSGCWDKVEVENVGYVTVIGLDKGNNGSIKVTFDIQNPQVGSSEIAKAENEPQSEVISFDAPDITSARDTANINVTRRLTFAHTKAIVIGEEFARTEKFYDVAGELLRGRELRGDALVVITKERAEEFMRENKPALETRKHKFYIFMGERWKETGVAPNSNVHRLLQRTEQDESLYLGIYGTARKSNETKYGKEDEYLPGEMDLKVENPIQMIGSAVFKNGKMIGSLTGNETRMALMLRKNFMLNGISASFQDPLDKEAAITVVEYKDKPPIIKINTSSDKPKIDVKVTVKIDVISIHSHIDYVEDLEKQDLLKQHIKKQLEERANKLVERTKNEFKAEPFVWGITARKNFWTYDDYVAYDWMNKYPNSDVNIEFDVSLVGFGKELKPSNVKKIRD